MKLAPTLTILSFLFLGMAPLHAERLYLCEGNVEHESRARECIEELYFWFDSLWPLSRA